MRVLVQAALLGGPTALAFFDGGYFDGPRAVAAMAVWILVAAAALLADRLPLPEDAFGRLALGGLAAFTGWVALSALWAPLAGPAQDDLIRDLLYLGGLALGLVAWRSRADLRRVEPALAAGTVVVIGYGLLGRLLPDLVDAPASLSAAGRLEQPLTYWNATGALGAVGLVLCARLAGDPSRGRALRASAWAAAAPLGTGVYLSFSRGAIAAALVGLALLALLVPSRAQVRGALLVLVAAVLGATGASFFGAVESLEGSPADARTQGFAVLLILAAIALTAVAVGWRLISNETAVHARPRPLRHGRLLGAAAAVVIVGAPLAAAAVDRQPVGATPQNATAERLGEVGSNRYGYWRVAIEDAVDHPLHGGGAGSFRVAWNRERTISEGARDAHSLPLETAAELGLVGLLALGAALGGVALAAAAVHRSEPALGAGLTAAAATWGAHATLDWDWEMPALTLVAVVAAGALIAAPSVLRLPAS